MGSKCRAKCLMRLNSCGKELQYKINFSMYCKCVWVYVLEYACLYYICMCICLWVMTVFDICLYIISILLASYACTLSVYAFKQEIFLLFLFSLSLRHQFLLYTYRSSRHYFSVKLCDQPDKSILKNKHWIAYMKI